MRNIIICWGKHRQMLSHFSQKRSLRIFLTFQPFCSTDCIRMRLIIIRVSSMLHERRRACHLARCKQMFRLAKLLIYNDYSGKENKSNSDGVKLCTMWAKLLNANENENNSHWYLRIVRVRKWGAVKIALSTSRNGAAIRAMCLSHKDILSIDITERGCVEINRVRGKF